MMNNTLADELARFDFKKAAVSPGFTCALPFARLACDRVEPRG